MEKEKKMNEQFTDFETAKAITELGFDTDELEKFYSAEGEWMQLKGVKPFDYSDKTEIYAPTWWQAKEWLWDKKLIRIKVEYTCKLFHAKAYAMYKTNSPKKLILTTNMFGSPIIAEIEGIKQAVKYLFENPK